MADCAGRHHTGSHDTGYHDIDRDRTERLTYSALGQGYDQFFLNLVPVL
ncbi:hypothetical protein COO91_10734 (plasmid) [Nostoc flagelliforme CCNUN1]|uniref:Uncharacterized protein n=1 Tax=Nostoc flagelliforme CCNUN1 TaxID=2038116 RepID=A0A2K8TBP9_9NOSO|nr:hypothetical protein COO91_10734 [Nostoc flagelliforme CCNUN1]